MKLLLDSILDLFCHPIGKDKASGRGAGKRRAREPKALAAHAANPALSSSTRIAHNHLCGSSGTSTHPLLVSKTLHAHVHRHNADKKTPTHQCRPGTGRIKAWAMTLGITVTPYSERPTQMSTDSVYTHMNPVSASLGEEGSYGSATTLHGQFLLSVVGWVVSTDRALYRFIAQEGSGHARSLL